MSNLNLKLFETLTPQKYAAERRFFIDKNAGNINERFVTFIANAVGHAMIHGDPTHCNNILLAAKVLRQFRMTKRVITPIVKPWKYNKDTEAFEGKADKALLNKLRATVEIDGEEVPRWEQILHERLNAEEAQEKQSAKQDFDLLKECDRVVAMVCRKAVEHGLTESEAKETLTRRIKAA